MLERSKYSHKEIQPAFAHRRASSRRDGGGDAVVDPDGLRSVDKGVQAPVSGTQFKGGELLHLHQGQWDAGVEKQSRNLAKNGQT